LGPSPISHHPAKYAQPDANAWIFQQSTSSSGAAACGQQGVELDRGCTQGGLLHQVPLGPPWATYPAAQHARWLLQHVQDQHNRAMSCAPSTPRSWIGWQIAGLAVAPKKTDPSHYCLMLSYACLGQPPVPCAPQVSGQRRPGAGHAHVCSSRTPLPVSHGTHCPTLREQSSVQQNLSTFTKQSPCIRSLFATDPTSRSTPGFPPPFSTPAILLFLLHRRIWACNLGPHPGDTAALCKTPCNHRSCLRRPLGHMCLWHHSV
jgi:hypothetical protein